MQLWENILNVTAKLLCNVYTFFIMLFPVELISIFLTAMVWRNGLLKGSGFADAAVGMPC